ncbi:MAG TPA: hypothetical protein DCO77_10255 [Nitrospiraceae bacterium]|nr:hypothetical protein [Nitrospiraceae bacterium]
MVGIFFKQKSNNNKGEWVMATKKRQMLNWMLIALLAAVILPACGGGGGGTPPPAYVINTAGGNGGDTSGTGGSGGFVNIAKFGGTGAVEVLTSGTVDASFTASTATPYLGIKPLSITKNTTIFFVDNSLPGATDPASGTPYLTNIDTNLRISDANGVVGDENPAVTGLSVAADVTVTLELNSIGSEVLVSFANDVDNRGTITTLDTVATQRVGLFITCDNYFGASGSLVDTSAGQTGQDGGGIEIAGQWIYNQGDFYSIGSDDPSGSGSDGGPIILAGLSALENSGALSSAGGAGGVGTGGVGGSIVLHASFDHLYNSGTVSAHGGNGLSGGAGGTIALTAGHVPAVITDPYGVAAMRNSGALNSRGGDGAGGHGGPGGAITVWKLGPALLFNADITTEGGDTSKSAFNGGNGGDVEIYGLPGIDGDVYVGAGDMEISGNITTTGGSAVASGSGSGGNGGGVNIIQDASGRFLQSLFGINPVKAPANPRLALRGFTSMNTTGGQGNSGGNGGPLGVVDVGEVWDGIVPTPPSTTYTFLDDSGGDVINEAAITTRGGSVFTTATTPASGGSGGNVYLTADIDPSITNATGEYLTNYGNIDSSGGDSLALTAAPGINAGRIMLNATNDTRNSGALTADGGTDGGTTTGYGHDSSEIVIKSELGAVNNTGLLNATGGDGITQGGAGSQQRTTVPSFEGVLLEAGTDLGNSGNINARGGDADVNFSVSVGGDGGDVRGIYGGSRNHTGSVNVNGGAGQMPGAVGTNNL